MRPMFLIRSSAIRRRAAWLTAGGLAWVGLLSVVTLARGAETNRLAPEVVIPKSVFVSEGAIGKDPFFPNSTRPLNRKAPEDPGKKPVVQDFSQLLVLKGITGPPEKRIALINNLTFSKGEEGEPKAGNGKVKIRVLEIREKSVVISMEGVATPKELLLQDKLLPVGE